MFEEVFCVLRMRNQLIFIFDLLYLVTDVSYVDEKRVFFSLFLALSCGVNNFVLEEHFILTIFTL